MKSWKGTSCRKRVRFLELERTAAVEGIALGRDERPQPRGVLPRPLTEIDTDLALWRSRLAGPEPAAAPDVPEAQRPTCRQCGARLRPTFETVTRRVDTVEGFHHVDDPGTLRGFGYGARGHFCTMTCGWRYAVTLCDSVQTFQKGAT